MPGYEVMALFRRMARPETAAGVKRVAEELIKQGTLVRKVESLGERKLAFKIKDMEQTKHDSAHYIVFHVNSHYDDIEKIRGVLDRDRDIIRHGYHMDPAFDEKPNFDCADPLWHQDSPFERF